MNSLDDTPRCCLVDAHCHLQEEVFEGLVPEIVQRARAVGVCKMVCNGTHPGDWQAVRQLAQDYPEVVPCFGLHPWFINEAPENWRDLLDEELTQGAVAVGEIGLDRMFCKGEAAAQEEVFVYQLQLAKNHNLPVVIHCLKAWGWLLEILQREGAPERGFMIHAWSGAAELVPDFVKLGGYFSFAANVLDDRVRKARAALQVVSLERLLIETDSPALLPPDKYFPNQLTGPENAKLNEPANLPVILQGIAQLRGVIWEKLQKTSIKNTNRFFGEKIV